MDGGHQEIQCPEPAGKRCLGSCDEAGLSAREEETPYEGRFAGVSAHLFPSGGTGQSGQESLHRVVRRQLQEAEHRGDLQPDLQRRAPGEKRCRPCSHTGQTPERDGAQRSGVPPAGASSGIRA